MTDFASTAYMLVSHGSRDPRPGRAMERLAQVVLAQLQRQKAAAQGQSSAVKVALAQNFQAQAKPSWASGSSVQDSSSEQQTPSTPERRWSQVPAFPLVGTGCLELSPIPLHQQIIDFSRRAAAAGVSTIRVVPLFLLKGVHVMEDIPTEAQQAQQALPDLTIELCPHLGSHPSLKRLLRSKRQGTQNGKLLLLAHGSRRPGGNAPIQAVAETLEGTAAFWAVKPSLEDQVIQLMQNGTQQLTILPYFLFAGKTTDAIARTTEELAERFPQMQFHLLPPLGPTEDMGALVTDLALDRVKPNTQKASLPLQRTAFRYRLPSFLVS